MRENTKNEDKSAKSQSHPISVYQFNDEVNDFEELIIDPGTNLKDLLDDDFILLFVEPRHFRVWLWHGFNTTTRMKFIAAKMASAIRDKHGLAFKIIAVDQDYENREFLVMVGLAEEIYHDQAQTGPTYEGTTEDLELFESLSKEKIFHLLEKVGIRKKILIIDDEEDITILTKKFLQLENYDTISCSNGYDALNILEEKHEEIELVLLDVMLSGMDGYEILSKIKSKYPNILVVLFTVKNFFEDIKKGKKLGADGYLVKNFFDNDGDDDRFPYPYIFTHPRPPDDFAAATQVHVRTPLKEKAPEDEVNCQYCGKLITEEEQSAHSCKKKPNNR